MSDSGLLSPPDLVDPYSFLGSDGRGFYIPSYQRNFAWGKEHTSRFFESFVSGINDLIPSSDGLSNPDRETFIGTVVCFHDSPPFNTVYPFCDNDYPNQVNVVIDGQQRITVCLILAQLFHDYLRNNLINDLSALDEEKSYLKSIQSDMMDDLESMLLASGKKRYPSLIRGPKDCWSKDENKSCYASPVSRLISSYTEFLRNENKKFRMDRMPGKENTDFHSVYSFAKKTIEKYIAKGEDKDLSNYEDCPFDEYPDIRKIFSDANIMTKLFNAMPPKRDIFNILKNTWIRAEQEQDAIDKTQKEACDKAEKKSKKAKEELDRAIEVSRCMLAASYFMHRIKFVSMITTNQDYAFGIFDSLNTTGDPLTAYETFKPFVINNFSTTDEYEASEEKKHFEEIDKYLNVEVKKQSKKTAEFITAFALAETGNELGKGLSEQRKYLLDSYKGANKEIGFSRQLLRTARVNECLVESKVRTIQKELDKFLENPDISPNEQQKRYSREARFCLEFLGAAKHTVPIALISRFYAKALDVKTANDHEALCKTIRSVAAFFALWRMSRESTDNIAHHHRNIMRFPVLSSNIEENHLLLLARGYARRRAKDSNVLGNDLLFERLANEFRDLLSNEKRTRRPIKNSGEWIDCSVQIPIYRTAREVAKFILLLSIYGSEYASSSSPVSDLIFTRALWTHAGHESIEHIIPQDKEKEIQSAAKKNLLHSIGNLTLLPTEINSSLGNISWDKKKLIYYALANDVLLEDKETVDSELEMDIDMRNKIEVIIKEKYNEKCPCRFLPAMSEIADLSDIRQFNFETIKHRSNKILNIVWPILYNWLYSHPLVR